MRSSFSDVEGTWIVPEAEWMREVVVCGAAIVKDEARVASTACPTGRASAIASSPPSPSKNIVVDMIAQNVGTGGKAAIGFTVPAQRAARDAGRALSRSAAELGADVEHEEDVSKVSIVGTGMRTHTGVAERMFAALAAAGVNMKMITTGDIKISVLVEKEPTASRPAGGASGVRPRQAPHRRRIPVPVPVQPQRAAGSRQQ